MADQDWTDAEVKTLKTKWADCKTAKQITAYLPGRTRNAILGKLERLGIGNSARPVRKPRGPTFRPLKKRKS